MFKKTELVSKSLRSDLAANFPGTRGAPLVQRLPRSNT